MGEPLHPVDAVDAGTLRVVLLEDNAFDAELTIEALCRARRCTVTTTRSRTEFEAAVSPDVDIILSDYSLPGFCGSEALEYAREHCPDVPFVFISGVLGEEHAVDMLKLGATDYVVKSRLARLPLVVERAIAETSERRHRRLAERALRESEDTFARVIESLEDYAVILLGPDGRIRNGNHASARIFGRSLADSVGQPLALLYPADAGTSDGNDGPESLLDAAGKRGNCSDERWLVRGNGERFFASCVITAFHDDAGSLSGFSLIVRDTTQARASAEALQQAKLAAERASHAKDRFIAVLSHELRTPLVPIMTGAHLLQMKLKLPPDMANIVRMIRRNAALEARLIDDLLDVTSIERGKLTLDMQPLDIADAVHAAIENTREDIERKGLRVTLDLAAEQTRVEADEARLQQILLNLIHNAIKFTPDGGTIEISTCNPQPGRVEVAVRDSGVGIDAESLQRIFSPFEQADGTRASGYSGLGLGLAIAQGLAARHGGMLHATSDGRGCGSRFALQLPLAEAAIGTDDGRTSELRPLRHGLAVLLVEDNPDSEAVFRHALELAGHRVTPVRSVAAAREAIAGGRFDIAISDIGLPDGSGLEIARAIAGRFPCIAVSGFGMSENRSASLKAGFAEHLIKPIDHTHLQAAIARAIAGATRAG